MQEISYGATRYDKATIFLHWATAILVAVQWLGAQVIDLFPRGPLRVDARSVHISLGAALAVIVIVRLGWRLTRGRRLPPSEGGALMALARAAHGGLYALLLAMVTVGFALTWVRGDSLFNLVSIPAFDPTSRALVGPLQECHELIATLLLVLAGGHALAALVHRYVWRDGVLNRMLPHG